MTILSDTFKIEATYDELLFMYEGMMRALDDMIEKRKSKIAEHKGIPEPEEKLFMARDKQCFDLSIVLGKKEEFLKARGLNE